LVVRSGGRPQGRRDSLLFIEMIKRRLRRRLLSEQQFICESIGGNDVAKLVDLAGQKFGRWTVISRATSNRCGASMWLCRCDCGTEKTIRHSSLTSGNSRSCGCLHREITSRTHKTHGHYGERLYGVWNEMKQRCGNPNNHKYKDYGGRGIKVCDAWQDYATFRAWAMSHGYDVNARYGDCTIDRIDVDGDYCPGNCRFADAKMQAKNRRYNHNQYT